MVMLAAIGYTYSQDNITDERRVWQCLPARRKVFGEVKHQFIDAHREVSAFQQRRVTAPVLVGNDASQKMPRVPFNPEHRYSDASARQATCGIQHMRSESAHYQQLFNLLSMSRMIIPESAVSVGNRPQVDNFLKPQ